MDNRIYPENRPPQSFKYEPLPDLSQYEEVSYVPAPEENEIIKKYHALFNVYLDSRRRGWKSFWFNPALFFAEFDLDLRGGVIGYRF